MTAVERPSILPVDGRYWRTPLTGIAPRRVGSARLAPTTYGLGYYRLEGIGGHDYFQVVRRRLKVMTLEREVPTGSTDRIRLGEIEGWDQGLWKVWMVDDPLHWLGMRERVAAIPPGASVLCAGLGLGLMLHHLAERDDVGPITVVEIDPDVVELVGPTLPPDDRVTIVTGDYYAYCREPGVRPDAILWDLAVGERDETRADFMKARLFAEIDQPQALLLRFGERPKR